MMDAYDAAAWAFGKCTSKNPDKNDTCSRWLAKHKLMSNGIKGEELEEAMEHVHRMMDEWHARKTSEGKAFFPQPEDYRITDEHDSYDDADEQEEE